MGCGWESTCCFGGGKLQLRNCHMARLRIHRFVHSLLLSLLFVHFFLCCSIKLLLSEPTSFASSGLGQCGGLQFTALSWSFVLCSWVKVRVWHISEQGIMLHRAVGSVSKHSSKIIRCVWGNRAEISQQSTDSSSFVF